MAIIHSVPLASLYDIWQRRNDHYYTLLDAMHVRTFENNLHAPMQIRCIHSIAWNGKPKHICQRICIFTRFSNSSFRNGDVVIGSESTVYRHIYWLTFGRKNYILLMRYTRIMQRITFLPPIVKKIIGDPETLWIGGCYNFTFIDIVVRTFTTVRLFQVVIPQCFLLVLK